MKEQTSKKIIVIKKGKYGIRKEAMGCCHQGPTAEN